MRESPLTFYFHDYETWGLRPSRDRPWQFAGIRTDADFNIIGDPLTVYCQPPADRLPSPEACLVTGVVPQDVKAVGVSECAFAEAVHAELSLGGTCGVGFNSFGFDDEVTRHLLYRNFYDPYAREWENGNTRWDLVDVARAHHALRPEGVVWPSREDGTPSFTLADLAGANGLAHDNAHDARSDVAATLALAKLMRAAQPKLFEYLLGLRDKRFVESLFDMRARNPVLLVAGIIPASRRCGALMMPLVHKPGDRNGIVCFDLSADPEPLLTLDAEEIHRRVFTPGADLEVERVALTTVRINRSPVVMRANVVDKRIAARLDIDPARCETHRRQLLEAPGLADKIREVMSVPPAQVVCDPEEALYSGGFLCDADRALFPQLRGAPAARLAELGKRLRDPRLKELLFRYRARNHPECLSPGERGAWARFCHGRLASPTGTRAYLCELARLEATVLDADRRSLLSRLRSYADQLHEMSAPS